MAIIWGGLKIQHQNHSKGDLELKKRKKKNGKEYHLSRLFEFVVEIIQKGI